MLQITRSRALRKRNILQKGKNAHAKGQVQLEWKCLSFSSRIFTLVRYLHLCQESWWKLLSTSWQIDSRIKLGDPSKQLLWVDLRASHFSFQWLMAMRAHFCINSTRPDVSQLQILEMCMSAEALKLWKNGSGSKGLAKLTTIFKSSNYCF